MLIFFLLLIPQAIAPDSILNEVDQRLARIRTIQGEIRREIHLSRAGKMEMVGKFYIVLPNRLRFDFALPDEQYFITDGRFLWVYNPEKNELITRDIGNIQPVEKHGIGALMDFGASLLTLMSKNYSLKLDYKGRLLKYNIYLISGVARDTSSPTNKILIWIDQDNYLIRRFETYGKKGNLTSIYVVEKEKVFNDSITIPVQYEIRVGTKGGLMRIKNYLSLIELNTAIPESLFIPPRMEE
ncbi:MAG: outer-membrane lipoprotein carrier protein LolA [candidate division WOR-3 bacterium]